MPLRLPLCTLVVLFATLLATFSAPAVAFNLGLPWGCNNDWARELATSNQIRYYHHWQGRHVAQLSRAGIEFVPMRWGPKKNEDWPKLKKLFPKYKYKHTLAYNEPDISTQADLSPKKAANLWVKELAPLRERYGTQVSSPQICWDINWLSKFMKHLNKKGQDTSFIAAHYYGSWNSINRLKKYIHKLHRRWPNHKIWITEYGVTSSSNPSAAQAKQFMVEATNFFASTGYVEAAFPFGMFAVPPDAFGSRQNAAFKSSGRLRSLGRYYKHYTNYKRSVAAGELKGAMRRRHEHLLKRLEQPDPTDEELWDKHPNETHCDELCQKRDSILDAEDDDVDVSLDDEDDAEEDDVPDADAFTEEDAKYWPTEDDEADESQDQEHP